jgi:hypothetical protein
MKGRPTISIEIQFLPDGKLASRPQTKLIEQSSPDARETANALVSAVERCPPLAALGADGIPRIWRDVVLFISLE